MSELFALCAEASDMQSVTTNTPLLENPTPRGWKHQIESKRQGEMLSKPRPQKYDNHKTKTRHCAAQRRCGCRLSLPLKIQPPGAASIR